MGGQLSFSNFQVSKESRSLSYTHSLLTCNSLPMKYWLSQCINQSIHHHILRWFIALTDENCSANLEFTLVPRQRSF